MERMKLIAVGTLLILSSYIWAARQDVPQAERLSINLRNIARQHSFALQDSVELDFEIMNSGSAPVGIFAKLGMGYQGGIILHVLDTSGAEVEPPTLAHDSLDVRAMQDARNYFQLQPGQFFGTRQRFVVAQLVNKPGNYKLLAEYHCPVDSKYAKVAHFWGIERKSIVSSGIEFNVQ